MKIVVLDGYTENPGDLSWSGFEALGQTVVYDDTPPELVTSRAAGADAVIVNKVKLTAEVIDSLPSLRYIGLLATGYNVVDVEHAAKKLIPVCNIPTYGTRTVAQMTFAFILEIYNRVGEHAESVRRGDWAKAPYFCYTLAPLKELMGLTLGIMGYGKIGRAVAEIAKAFGMKVVAHDPYYHQDEDGVRCVSQQELFAVSDIITFHCNLTAENTGIVNKQTISGMKDGAVIINTARGGLLVEADVREALESGKLYAVGVDVLSVEPPRSGNALIGAPNAFVTPHIAWATHEARDRLMQLAVDNLAAFMAGRTQNCVWTL